MYRWLFLISGVFALLLGVLLIVAPQIYLSLYVETYGTPMAFAAQRLAPAIMGLGALLLLARSQPEGPFVVRFAALSSLVWFGVAATGVFHFQTGVANSNILVAAGTEVVLGALFLMAAKRAGDVARDS